MKKTLRSNDLLVQALGFYLKGSWDLVTKVTILIITYNPS